MANIVLIVDKKRQSTKFRIQTNGSEALLAESESPDHVNRKVAVF